MGCASPGNRNASRSSRIASAIDFCVNGSAEGHEGRARAWATYTLEIKEADICLEQVQPVGVADVFSQKFLVQSAVTSQKDRKSLDVVWIVVLARSVSIYQGMLLQIGNSLFRLCIECLSTGDEETFTVFLSSEFFY